MIKDSLSISSLGCHALTANSLASLGWSFDNGPGRLVKERT